MNKQNKMKTDSEIQRTNEWLPKRKICEGVKEVEAWSYKINKTHGHNIEHMEYGQ